ncbi:hypothetical protein GCM10029992_44040 [Glycomyces albus]
MSTTPDRPATGSSTGPAIVAIPTYNERDNLERTVTEARDACPEADLLIVDDNSPDGTGELADGLAKTDDAVHVLHRATKQGLGSAYLAAFAWARSATTPPWSRWTPTAPTTRPTCPGSWPP